MKRVLALAAAFGLVLIFSNGCEKNETTGRYEIVGYFSWPTFFIYNTDATTSTDDFWNPITGGTPVTDATVVVTNNTTSDEVTLTYHPPGDYHLVGRYMPESENWSQDAGDEISVSITIGDQTYTGGPTATPDAVATITAPADESQVSQPFDLTWTLAHETAAASHVVVSVSNYNLDPSVMESWLLPSTTTSREISGYPPAELYYLRTFAVNRMAITGHGQTYYAYIGSTGYSMASRVEIISGGR